MSNRAFYFIHENDREQEYGSLEEAVVEHFRDMAEEIVPVPCCVSHYEVPSIPPGLLDEIAEKLLVVGCRWIATGVGSDGDAQHFDAYEKGYAKRYILRAVESLTEQLPHGLATFVGCVDLDVQRVTRILMEAGLI